MRVRWIAAVAAAALWLGLEGSALAMDGVPGPGGGGGGGGGGPIVDPTFSQSMRNWLSGNLYAAFQWVAIDDNFHFIDTLLGRGSGAPGSAPSGSTALGFAPAASRTPMIDQALAYAGPATDMPAPMRDGWSGWVKASYGTGSVSGDANNFGFDYRTKDGIAGIDYSRGDWLIGGAVGLSRADLTQQVSTDTGTIDALHLGGYGSFRPGLWNFTAVVAYGRHDMSSQRLIQGAGAFASTHADSFGAGFEAAHRHMVWGGTVEPMAGIIYTRLDTGDFAETGATGFEIAANSATTESARVYAGARAYRTFRVDDTLLTPELHARIMQELISNQFGFSAAFLADPSSNTFLLTGLQPERTTGILGGGLAAQLGPVWRAVASYDAEVRSHDTAHRFGGGLRAIW